VEACTFQRPPFRVPRAVLRAVSIALVCALSFAVAAVHADSYDDRRVRAGARLFRSMLAAHTTLERRADAKGVLQVVVYGEPGGAKAKEIAALIAPADPAKAAVRGLPLAVRTMSTLPQGGEPVAGVFLAASPNAADLDRLVAWGIANGVIVYSPFEGHVERGVAGGLAIEAKVQPYVNLRTLEAAGIELKPFFLKVAKVQR